MSEPTFLIHALLLDGKGGARPLSWDEVKQWKSEDGVLWLHMDYTQDEARHWILNESGLDPFAAEAIIAEETRPRVVPMGDGLLLLLRGVNLNPGSDPEDMVSIRIWMNEHRIVSTRKRRLLTVSEIDEELQRQSGPVDSASLLVELVEKLTWRIGSVVDELEESLDTLEESIIADNTNVEFRMDLSQLRRQTVILRRYLSPQRDAINRLLIEKAHWLTDPHRYAFRETADRLIRQIEDLDAVRERAAVTQEELLNRLSDNLNKRMYVLSVVAAIFLPMGFLTGLMGINVGGIPLAESPMGFLICVSFLILLGGLQILVFKKMKWF